jgi:DMSO/TMAO reductase YedYZ molybdopterin-dependent catalytic subunit
VSPEDTNGALFVSVPAPLRDRLGQAWVTVRPCEFTNCFAGLAQALIASGATVTPCRGAVVPSRSRTGPPGRPAVAADTPRTTPPRAGALAGLAAGGLALGLSELFAAVVPGTPSLVGAVGDTVVDWLPESLVHFGIAIWGGADKAVLVAGVLAGCALAGGALGAAASRSPGRARVGFAAFAVAGVAAALRDPRTEPLAVVASTALAVVAGLAALAGLLRLAPPLPASRPGRRTAEPIGVPDRRAFLGAVATVAAGAAVSAVAGRRLTHNSAAASRSRYSLPAPARPVAPPPSGASLPVEGLTPLVVPNDVFYRIDTRLLGPPAVDADRWRLRVTGMVKRPFKLSFAELLAEPLGEEHLTLACVSNEVGGDLIGTAAWVGTPLADLLGRAGVKRGATQIVGRSVDGFTVGFPTDVGLDGRRALVALGMNGELLPLIHGFPARLVVAGLYGYTSATKWLSEIELARWEDFDAYWIPRGWSKFAPVKTQSRIDTVVPNSPIVAGPLVVAGVAWAPTRRVSRVEVQVDDAPWVEAELAESLSDDTWRQWRFGWQAPPGLHVLRVRATDGHGALQSASVSDPPPDGATGYHTVRVRVREA